MHKTIHPSRSTRQKWVVECGITHFVMFLFGSEGLFLFFQNKYGGNRQSTDESGQQRRNVLELFNSQYVKIVELFL